MTCLKWAPGQEPTPTKGSASSSFPPSSCLCVRVCGRAHSLESFISRSLSVPQHLHLLPHRGGKKGQHLLSIPFLLALVFPGPCGSWAPSQQQSHIVFSCSYKDRRSPFPPSLLPRQSRRFCQTIILCPGEASSLGTDMSGALTQLPR